MPSTYGCLFTYSFQSKVNMLSLNEMLMLIIGGARSNWMLGARTHTNTHTHTHRTHAFEAIAGRFEVDSCVVIVCAKLEAGLMS